MLVGDIYGERDYTSIGLSATTIASSFGKVGLCHRAFGCSARATACVMRGARGCKPVRGRDRGAAAAASTILLSHVVRAPRLL